MTLTLITINGTLSYPTDPLNFPSLCAYALLPSEWSGVSANLAGVRPPTPIINWVPLDYPMSIYPMGASVNTGVVQLISQINAVPMGSPIAVAAYSQGAIVWSRVWRDYILNPGGALNHRLNDFVAAVTWGNPMRAPNVCNGNVYAGWNFQGGGGISGTNDLLPYQVPTWWLDFANPNDLYTDSPVAVNATGAQIVMGNAAIDEELIYNMVVSTSFGGTLMGLLRLIESAVTQFAAPLSEVIGLATSIFNGLKFFGSGPAAGHYTYDPAPAIGYLNSVALNYL